MPAPATIERVHRPVPVPPCVAGAGRVLFFGGSFDPVHDGHATLPFEVARRWGGDDAWVVFVPAARSPHKPEPPAPDRHRVEMLRIALRARPRWWIWTQELADAELEPGRPSYWADTWAIARSVFGHGHAFLIGVDQALAMHRWRRYRAFWSDALVMQREDETDPDAFAAAVRATGAWTDAEATAWARRLVTASTVRASSTRIRAALADPERRNARIEGLDPGVQRYVLDRGLYAPA